VVALAIDFGFWVWGLGIYTNANYSHCVLFFNTNQIKSKGGPPGSRTMFIHKSNQTKRRPPQGPPNYVYTQIKSNQKAALWAADQWSAVKAQLLSFTTKKIKKKRERCGL